VAGRVSVGGYNKHVGDVSEVHLKGDWFGLLLQVKGPGSPAIKALTAWSRRGCSKTLHWRGHSIPASIRGGGAL